MPARPLSTRTLTRVVAALLAARLLYVYASRPAPFGRAPAATPGAVPALPQPVLKDDPLLKAIALGDAGRLEESERALKALHDPRTAMVHNALGVVYYRQQKLEPALSEFNQALAADPKLADAYSNRATVRWLKGDRAGAVADFRKVLELKPAAPGQLGFAQKELARVAAPTTEKKP